MSSSLPFSQNAEIILCVTAVQQSNFVTFTRFKKKPVRQKSKKEQNCGMSRDSGVSGRKRAAAKKTYSFSLSESVLIFRNLDKKQCVLQITHQREMPSFKVSKLKKKR